MTQQHVVIVGGAGIVGGAATAIWLRRAGVEVTLLDRGGDPGMGGASYGNGCVLASCAMVPVTTPGLLTKGPGYLLDPPNFPLFLRWSYLPKLAPPWLVRYLSHANEKDTRRIAQGGLSHVVGDSLEQHRALTAGTEVAKWVQPSDYSFAYRDRAAFDADSFIWQLRKEAGFEPELVDGREVQEHEPILSPPEIQLLAVMKNHGYILNPAGYVTDLVALLQQMGGRFIRAEVKDFDLSGGRIRAVETDHGRFDCDQAVLAAGGVWSGPLMGKLGLTVPLEAERGYHIVFKNPPNVLPRNPPMMLTSGKFVATPMDQGLRCAGVVELGGMTEKLSPGPLNLLRRKVAEVFPTLTATEEEEWMGGFRPAPPTDSLPPLIGELRDTGVFTAFGHHHIGLTGGPKTGRMVADMITGKPINIDTQPYTPPMRFGR